MQNDQSFVVSATTIRDAVYAALRVLTVLIGGLTALAGFVDRRDLAGLIAYVQSDDFLAVAGALASAGSFLWGVWKTYRTKSRLIVAANAAPNDVARVEQPRPGGTCVPVTVLVPFLGMAVLAGLVAGCSTPQTGRVLRSAQVALLAAQRGTLATCTAPPARLVEPCRQAIDVLHRGAQAEALAVVAYQTGNADDFNAALAQVATIPAQLVALGVLEDN